MGNSTLTGNAGISDVVSALRFIIHNVEVFNGDPENIALGGRFSGAMAISAIVTSDLFYTFVSLNFPMPL
jgi:carboxylesterase type B